MLISVLKTWAPFLVGHIFDWLEERALVIRKSDLAGVAAAAGITPEALQESLKTVEKSGLGYAEEYLQKHWGI
jgi:hypothetical protein